MTTTASRSFAASAQPTTLTTNNIKVCPVAHLQRTVLGLPEESIDCGYGSNTKTVFAVGNTGGDSNSLDLAMQQSAALAKSASEHGNRVVYAFMGNVVPAGHRPTATGSGSAIDSFSKVLDMAKNGIELSDRHSVRAEDVLLMSGTRELAWLRLANPNSDTREISHEYEGDAARAILLRETPLANVDGSAHNEALNTHNKGLQLLGVFKTTDEVAVAMLLKLVSMTRLTMQTPGLVELFAAQLLAQGGQDSASLETLLKFLHNLNGGIEEGVSKLRDRSELTPEGMGITPASKAVVSFVLRFAHTVAIRYTCKSKLLHYIAAEGSDDKFGLWLTPQGYDGDHAVDEVLFRAYGSRTNTIQWSIALNKAFQDFVFTFMKGDNTAQTPMYVALVAMSLKTQATPLPLHGLAASPHATCSGITCDTSSPFGTIQRRILVNGEFRHPHQSDLIAVLDQWVNINAEHYAPSAYWSVATWCGSTKTDIDAHLTHIHNAYPLQLEMQMWHVSVTLASLLSVRVNGRTVKEHGLASLSGKVGPVVPSTSPDRTQPMRLISFTHTGMEMVFVVMLPESFVQRALDYYNYDMQSANGNKSPMIATEGFLVLPDESSVPLGFPGLSEDDTELIRSELGTRVWSLPKKHSSRFTTAFAAVDANMRESNGPYRAFAVPGYSIFHTRQSSSDPFSGLNVGLETIPEKGYEARMTIGADSMPSHDVFRVVAELNE